MLKHFLLYFFIRRSLALFLSCVLCFSLSLSVCLSRRMDSSPPDAVSLPDCLEKEVVEAASLFDFVLSLSLSLARCLILFLKIRFVFSLSLTLSKAKAKDVQVKEKERADTNRVALKYTVQGMKRKTFPFTRASLAARAQTSTPARAGPTAQPSRATSSRRRRRRRRRRPARLPRRPAPSRGTLG